MSFNTTKRFIVLGHGRTGSNLLGASLDQHPGVTVHGELFHEDEAKRARWPAHGRYVRNDEDPIPFLEECAFAPGPEKRPLAVGFRLFYSHSAWSDAARTLWDHLAADPGLAVVHLVRRKLFDSYVSRQVAGRTGEWLRTMDAEATPPPDPFEVNVGHCLRYFDDIHRRRRSAGERFAGHPTFDVSYEEMVGDFQGTLDRAFAFLGVEPVPVRAPYRKQATRSVREQVSNYDALRETFRQTPYAAYFDD